jgi:hypothetical protein
MSGTASSVQYRLPARIGWRKLLIRRGGFGLHLPCGRSRRRDRKSVPTQGLLQVLYTNGCPATHSVTPVTPELL